MPSVSHLTEGASVDLQTIVKFFVDPTVVVFLLITLICLRRFQSLLGALTALLPIYLLMTTAGGYAVRSVWQVPDTVEPGKAYAIVAPLGGAGSQMRFEQADLYPVRDEPALFFNHRIARVVAALEVMTANPAAVLYYPQVLIKGRLRAHSETDAVRAFVLNRGIAPERFRVYASTRRTLDEAKKLRQVLDAEGNRDASFLLITSQMHMRRALAMFEAHGLRPDVQSVGRRTAPLGIEDFLPRYHGIVENMTVLYEWVAYAAYAVRGDL
ncbi:MAG: YdcF family protein [Pseudomonadota bacterium]